MLLSELLLTEAFADEHSIIKDIELCKIIKDKLKTASVRAHVFTYFDRCSKDVEANNVNGHYAFYDLNSASMSSFDAHRNAASLLFPAERKLFNNFMNPPVSNGFVKNYKEMYDSLRTNSAKTELIQSIEKTTFPGSRPFIKAYPYALDYSGENGIPRYKIIVVKNNRYFVVVLQVSMHNVTAKSIVVTAYEITLGRLVEIAEKTGSIDLLQIPALNSITPDLPIEGYKHCFESIGMPKQDIIKNLKALKKFKDEEIDAVMQKDVSNFFDED